MIVIFLNLAQHPPLSSSLSSSSLYVFNCNCLSLSNKGSAVFSTFTSCTDLLFPPFSKCLWRLVLFDVSSSENWCCRRELVWWLSSSVGGASVIVRPWRVICNSWWEPGSKSIATYIYHKQIDSDQKWIDWSNKMKLFCSKADTIWLNTLKVKYLRYNIITIRWVKYV